MRRKPHVSWLRKSLTIGLNIAFLFWAYFANLAPAMASEAIAVPGTTVSMTPPEGFVPATEFAGFVNKERQGSLLVVELPVGAMGQLLPLFGDQETAAKSFATKGITVTEREEIESANGDVVPLLHGTQEANGIVLDKWIALYGGEKTVLITFQIPQESALDPRDLRTVFRSVSTGTTPSIDEKLSALPFEFEVAEPFRVVDTMAGSSVIMMAGDKDVDPQGLQPMIIVSVSQARGDMSNLAAVAERSLRQTIGFEEAKITERIETTFAGTDGYRLAGTYDDKGIQKGFVQYLSFEGTRAIRLIGRANEKQFVSLQVTFETIAASVTFKE